MIAAFVDYATMRRDGLAPAAAYSAIGLHYGDDGLSRPSPSA